MTIPELVFIHGWGFDARFWDALAGQLSQFPQRRIDLGFFDTPTKISASSSPRILIGHSLGFVYGLKWQPGWKGWVAINSFPRFIATSSRAGCLPPSSLRELRMRLQSDPDKTLQDFYQLIGAEAIKGTINPAQLRAGLDELRDGDIGGILAALNVPGLVLAGGEDPLVPLPASEELGRAARRGGLMLHGEAGHLLPQTEPAWCAGAITNFMMANFG